MRREQLEGEAAELRAEVERLRDRAQSWERAANQWDDERKDAVESLATEAANVVKLVVDLGAAQVRVDELERAQIGGARRVERLKAEIGQLRASCAWCGGWHRTKRCADRRRRARR